ncbi:hypothetical protein NL108_017413 [Boleophthalmus pectinirostris]|uniref:proteasome assembly chaperone 1 n=1 Tax=Boleophthalmus pectinirostris TaxID=150288 RepID=UPI00242B1D54|nr:proteasome assembly chaperone 1 [Boleophthalmus pectinirostris]KAJ0062174.1 hypothetical protein NL108_017413 [Boleophthalmus pectinirostris]
MATFFGEVLPASSRAAYEDSEEEEEDEEDRDILRALEDKRLVRVNWSSSLELNLDSDNKLHCPHLLLTTGHNSSRFVSVYFLSRGTWDTVGRVSLWNERTVHCEDSVCVLQRHKDSQVLVCQVDCFVAEDQLFQWTEQVLGSLVVPQVTVLSDAPVTDYRSARPLGPDPCLRALHTSTFSESTCCPLVEPPNLLTGLPAAVLTWCELRGVGAVVYQCFSDVRSADSTVMSSFRPAVAHLTQHLQVDLCPDQDVLHKFVSQAPVQSNLYI